ncbi:Hypothetical_protein [Hexamita inflata]|uniref:Hypothetical_protein n=1 Tax=Hexamita inflata TaxID=28002 RepID=A0AA86RJ10_9EUKA|nr:Hypothetical protein HINF_LOCUS66621 [Hexamita inflata]
MNQLSNYSVSRSKLVPKHHFKSQFAQQYEQLNCYKVSDQVLVKELLKIDLMDEFYKNVEIQGNQFKMKKNLSVNSKMKLAELQNSQLLKTPKKTVKTQLEVFEIVRFNEQYKYWCSLASPRHNIKSPTNQGYQSYFIDCVASQQYCGVVLIHLYVA